MRRSYNGEFSINDNGVLVGINLGADFCAEHEWGISGLKNSFGLKDNLKVWGIEKRRIQVIPHELELLERKGQKNKKQYALVFNPSAAWLKEMYPDKDCFPSELSLYEGDMLAAAWDENSFGILVSSEHKEYLNEIMTAFHNKDIAIGLGGGHVFKNAGLSIMIISRLPKEYLESLYEKDKDYYELQKAAEKTGIKKVLEKANRRYFALSPRWADENKKTIRFWLNPMDQQTNKSGWYTVDDLKLWAKGEGPIINRR